MDRGFRPGEEEMFFTKPADACGDSPTVEPLRIFKPPTPKAQDRYKYPAPSSSKPPSFPLPPGASSSAMPLPYPDEEDTKPIRPLAGNPYGSPISPASPGDCNDTTPRLDMSPTDNRRTGLAERRGTAPRPLTGALSPISPGPESDGGLFAKPIAGKQSKQQQATAAQNINFPDYHRKTYYPPPRANSSNSNPSSNHNGPPPRADEEVDDEVQGSGVNRFASTASNSTTKASRGSPPPPETPIVGPGNLPDGGIEARFAASGISGTGSLNSFQSPAAAQRLAQYGQHPALRNEQQPAQQPQQSQQPQQAPRPWTPTESPEQQPHGPPVAYQGDRPVSPQQTAAKPKPRPRPSTSSSNGPSLQISVLEQDFQRMQMADPPPAYSSINPDGSTARPAEKQRPNEQQAGSSSTSNAAQAAASQGKQSSVAAAGLASPGIQHTGHPAFANDPRPDSVATTASAAPSKPAVSTPSPFQGQGPSSPPPLPEGWIAHLDQNSGQYYYIHLATQATQWEFPKGPTPMNHDVAPLSPVGSTYGNPLASPMFGGGKASLGSPMFPPATPGYAESIMSVAASTAPTGFTGPPPSAGVDMFKIQPTNGVYFGPYLRYVNMDIEHGKWMGSIVIITDTPQPPTIHIHPSVDLSPNPRQLISRIIYTHQRWQFHKYDIDLPMGESGTDRWTYAVTSHLGCTRYEFVVAGRYENNWRFIAHSGNDFAANTSQNERSKLGGVGFMWKDVLQKNVDCGGFHAQIGLGDQIYGDRLWKEVPVLKQWLAIPGKENRKSAPWTARHEEDVTHAYFHYYTSHFDQPFLREAWAQIPHVCQIDDHDIFDGYGSYPDYMQSSQIFKNIGRVAIDMYLLFQHHTTIEVLRNVSHDLDLFTVTGQGWHFVKYFGPALAVVGADLRSERTQARVMAGPTYQGLFPKIAMLPPSVQHCLLLLSVPIVYPRLDTVESLANTFATGKKAVNTTYNVLGKMTSSVAGIVGGKEMVASGFSSVKKAVGKSGLMGNVVNQFGDLDIGEILKDMWTHETKDLERTYLVRTLQGIAHQKGIRMTFLSGDVNCGGAGLLHDPSHPSDHKTMYQIITSPIVAAPASSYILKLLHNNKTYYVPANGHKSSPHDHDMTDTKEDMMEIFQNEATGNARELKKLMGRRNYVAFVAYDPEAIPGTQYAASVAGGGGQQTGLSKLSLAVDFVVQGDGSFNPPTKYGPVVVPHLEYGR